MRCRYARDSLWGLARKEEPSTSDVVSRAVNTKTAVRHGRLLLPSTCGLERPTRLAQLPRP
jgi:hypothetical protein